MLAFLETPPNWVNETRLGVSCGRCRVRQTARLCQCLLWAVAREVELRATRVCHSRAQYGQGARRCAYWAMVWIAPGRRNTFEKAFQRIHRSVAQIS
jgi:hypothetical protein